MELSAADKKRFEIYAKAEYPKEAVAIVLASSRLCLVKNAASDPFNSFRVGTRDLVRAKREGGIKAIIHSHPDTWPCPSEADMKAQLASTLPWGIMSISKEGECSPIIWWGGGTKRLPLLGRPFIHGITDCYALIKDYYDWELGIELPEFPRSWEWWKNGEDLYGRNFVKAGFRKLAEDEPRQKGDMWVAQIRSPVINHAGVLLESGLILHHPTSKGAVDFSHLSREEPYSRWEPFIVGCYRHEKY